VGQRLLATLGQQAPLDSASSSIDTLLQVPPRQGRSGTASDQSQPQHAMAASGSRAAGQAARQQSADHAAVSDHMPAIRSQAPEPRAVTSAGAARQAGRSSSQRRASQQQQQQQQQQDLPSQAGGLLALAPPWAVWPDFDQAKAVNNVLAQAWPVVKEAVRQQVLPQMQPVIDDLTEQYGLGIVRSLVLAHFDLGHTPPQLSGIKAYKSKQDEVILEAVVNWASDLDITLEAALQPPASLAELYRRARDLLTELCSGGGSGGSGGSGSSEGEAGDNNTITITLDLSAAATSDTGTTPSGSASQPAAAAGAQPVAASPVSTSSPGDAHSSGGLRLPLQLAKLQLRAHARITARPLLELFPYAGSVSATLLAPPEVDFDLPWGGVDLMSLPLVKLSTQRIIKVSELSAVTVSSPSAASHAVAK
jgi:hypothetical protein